MRNIDHYSSQFIRRILLSIFLLGLYWSSYASEPLRLLYENRAPFVFQTTDGKLSGLAVESLEPALKKAGIQYLWIETPFKRQFHIVEQGLEPSCAVAVFMNKERKHYAKFSAAIVHDRERPSIILGHRDFEIPAGLNLPGILALPAARLLIKEGASYGPYIDDTIEHSRVTLVRTTAGPLSIGRMLVAKRADFTFMSEVEANALIKNTPEGTKLRTYIPIGMPQGQDRFLMCSKKVPDELIQSLNRFLSP